MEKRVNIKEVEPNAYKAMNALDNYIAQSGFDKRLYELIKVRASQINGCTYCVDLHSRDARRLGETEQRLYALVAWRPTTFYTDRERAALAFTEAMTAISQNEISDELYQEVSKHFGPNEIAHLIMAIITINAWNRIGVGLKMMPNLL